MQKPETRNTKREIRNSENQGVKNEGKNAAEEKKQPGLSAEGPRDPGLSCPPPQCASKKLVRNP